MDSQSFSASSPSHHEPYKLKTSFSGESKHQTPSKSTLAPQQVHQHSQDEPTEEPTPDTSTQTLMNKCLAESGIDPTDIQNVMPVPYAKRNIPSHDSSRQIQTHQRYVFARVNQSKHHNCDDLDPTDTPSAVPTALQAPSDDTYNPKCTHSLMETQCNHSQCTHNPSTSQVSKSYHHNPVTFPYPPDPGEHVLETSSAPTTLVERDKLDLSSLIPPKGEMESPFSWTCPFKSPTSSTLCFGEPTLGKLNQETDFYMTKHMPKPSSGANRVSVRHSSLVTKNGEHFFGEKFIHDFPKSWKHIKEVDWGDKLKLNYTTYGYMLMEIDWGGKFNYTSCGHPMVNWQGHETHPTGHKTSEVDWGGHDPDGSDNPPPMSIINLDDLLGRTFLLPMDENGERKRATISEHVKDLCQQQVSREDQLRFKLKIDGDQLDDLVSYNQLMEYLEDKTDTGPLEDGLYRFKCIKDHKGPYTSSDPEYNGSSYNLLIEWETGEQTWEPLSNIIASDPYTCAVYDKEHNLLNTPGWKLLKRHARTARRLIRTLKKSKYRQARASRKYKHGWEVPRDYPHALQLDIHNGNNKWKEAIDLEIEQIKEYQVFKDSGKAVYDKKHITNAPKGHQTIKVHFVFDVKHCGKFKARLLADGHFTKEPMETVYSGMFLAEPNNLELWGADAGHAYNLQALTREKLNTVGGPECWHDKFFEILHQMGFKPSRADPDTWMKYSMDGSHYEYIAVYIDDLAIYMEDPKSFCDKLREVAPINYHLGCGYTRDEDNPTNTLSKHWKYASIWPLLKPQLFWKGDTDELNAKTKGSDRISTKKEPCLTPTLMDEGQARNPNTTYNGYKMEFWKFALTWKLICPVQHKITQKEQKETTKKGGISLTIMGQRQTYNSIHKPQRSHNETIGFNQDDHPYRMCNETGIPEFLELQIPGIPMVVMVTSRTRSLHDSTQQDFSNVRTLPIYKCHTCFKF